MEVEVWTGVLLSRR